MKDIIESRIEGALRAWAEKYLGQRLPGAAISKSDLANLVSEDPIAFTAWSLKLLLDQSQGEEQQITSTQTVKTTTSKTLRYARIRKTSGTLTDSGIGRQKAKRIQTASSLKKLSGRLGDCEEKVSRVLRWPNDFD